MSLRTFEITIEGITKLSQSKYMNKMKEDGESDNDHEQRRWREKMHVDAKGNVVIPATGIMDAIQTGAGLDDEKVQGRGNRKWGTLFKGGISIYEDVTLNVKADEVPCETFMCDSKGQKGDRSTSRVPRIFPMVPAGWTGTVRIDVLDAAIPAERLKAAIETAGLRVGVGRFRPSKGGTNGRFIVKAFREVSP